MNVLLIIPNLGPGGAQRVFHDHFEVLSPDFDVTLSVFNWDGAFGREKEMDIISLDVPAGTHLLEKIYFFYLRIARLKRLKRAKAIDVSISHLEGADYVNILSAKSDKTICWIHGSKIADRNIHGLTGFLRRRILMPFLYRRADRIITVSDGLRYELNELLKLPNNVLTVHNGFRIDKIDMMRSEAVSEDFKNLANNHPLAISHCRLASQKNLRSLLLIASETLKTTSFKLAILGDGELRDDLVSFSRSLHLKTWSVWESAKWNSDCDIFFLGSQSNPFKFLNLSSIFVLTSSWEGFPLSLGEALVCGLPVIAADCPTGPKEFLAPELPLDFIIDKPYSGNFGLLLPVPEIQSSARISMWSEALNRMISNKEMRDIYRVKAQRRAHDFAFDKMTKELKAVLVDFKEN